MIQATHSESNSEQCIGAIGNPACGDNVVGSLSVAGLIAARSPVGCDLVLINQAVKECL